MIVTPWVQRSKTSKSSYERTQFIYFCFFKRFVELKRHGRTCSSWKRSRAKDTLLTTVDFFLIAEFVTVREKNNRPLTVKGRYAYYSVRFGDHRRTRLYDEINLQLRLHNPVDLASSNSFLTMAEPIVWRRVAQKWKFQPSRRPGTPEKKNSEDDDDDGHRRDTRGGSRCRDDDLAAIVGSRARSARQSRTENITKNSKRYVSQYAIIAMIISSRNHRHFTHTTERSLYHLQLCSCRRFGRSARLAQD